MPPCAEQQPHPRPRDGELQPSVPRPASLCAKTVKCMVSCRGVLMMAVKDGCMVWTLGPGWTAWNGMGGAGRGRRKAHRDGTLRFGCGVSSTFSNPHLMDVRGLEWRGGSFKLQGQPRRIKIHCASTPFIRRFNRQHHSAPTPVSHLSFAPPHHRPRNYK